MASLPRRLVSFPVAFGLLPFGVLITPLLAPLLALTDLVTGRRRLPSARLWIFFLVFLAHEWVAQPKALAYWLTGGFGRRLDHQKHSRLQGWWAGSLFEWAGRILNVHLELPDHSSLPDGPLIILSRHASMADALIPAYLLAGKADRPIHYVLKKELHWVPAIDVFGHRLRNHFVTRGGNTESEVADIRALADTAEPGAAMAIFPEGTYATDITRAKVRASLERRGDAELVALADELQQLLPPKPAGALALMSEMPDAPIVILGHVGMEGVAELDGLRTHLPASRPVTVEWWVHERSTVPPPDDEAGQTRWLQARWRELDHWVQQQLDQPS